MRTAILFMDGKTQVALLPESDHEKRALEMLKDADSVETYAGSFYDCEGGWTRLDLDHPTPTPYGTDFSGLFLVVVDHESPERK